MQCGVIPHRIVGGSEIIPHSIPWQVGLVSIGESTPFCGGTLLGPRHVISAAHCTQVYSQFSVLIGEHDLTDGTDGTFHSVESFTEHPNFSYAPVPTFDFVMITLAEPVVLRGTAVPACLPTENMDEMFLTGKSLTVSGWGNLQEGGNQALELHKVEVPFVPAEVCNDAYPGLISNAMVCAGNVTDGGIDSCQGDSGGMCSSMNL